VSVINPLLGLNSLGGEASTESYKLGPQACFLVERMAESEKTVLDVLSVLTEKLTMLEKKVDSYSGDVGKV
jgi:hypothetical protein